MADSKGAPNGSHYQYSPLTEPDQIRLLRIGRVYQLPRVASRSPRYGKARSDESCFTYSIIHSSLRDPLKYEAVSYVWGDSAKSESITLHDGRVLMLTRSVARAIPHLVKASQTSYLWLDQISINQLDIAERGHQVEIMGKIYAKCARVIIWIDIYPHSENSATCSYCKPMESGIVKEATVSEIEQWTYDDSTKLQNLLESFQRGRNTRLNRYLEGQRTETTERHSEDSFSPRTRKHLIWLLNNPWFGRSWIFQEYVLAEQAVFLIGDFEMPRQAVALMFESCWPQSEAWLRTFVGRLYPNQAYHIEHIPKHALSFFTAVVLYKYLDGGDRHPESHDYQIYSVLRYVRKISASNVRIHRDRPDLTWKDTIFSVKQHTFANYASTAFVELVQSMAATNAKDAHDHVYAFLGIAPFLLKHMKVDYAQPLEMTFANFAKAIVMNSSSFEVLAYVPSTPDHTLESSRLPSWTPNWAATLDRVSLLTYDTRFAAAGCGFVLPDLSACRHAQDTPAWNVLAAAGKIVGCLARKLRSYSVYQVQALRTDPVHLELHDLSWHRSILDRYMHELGELGYQDFGRTSRISALRALLADGVKWSALTKVTRGEDNLHPYRKPEGTHNEKIEDVINAILSLEDQNPATLPDTATVQVLHELSTVQYGRRLAYSTEERFGLVPNHAEEGDKIVILHGSRVPFVLRPRSDGNFTVIGECFYDGAMYGEMADPIDENAEIFKLV